MQRLQHLHDRGRQLLGAANATQATGIESSCWAQLADRTRLRGGGGGGGGASALTGGGSLAADNVQTRRSAAAETSGESRNWCMSGRAAPYSCVVRDSI